MARGRSQEWNIAFKVTVSDGGYAWQLNDRDCLVLAPKDYWQDGAPGRRRPSNTPRAFTTHWGLGAAREAFNCFHSLAKGLYAEEQRVRSTLLNKSVDSHEAYEISEASWTTRQDLILNYANKFGALWGDFDQRTVDSWVSEAGQFLELRQIARVLSPGGSLREFATRVKGPTEESRIVRYNGDHHNFTFPPPGSGSGDRDDLSGVMVLQRDYYEEALRGSPRVKARMLLTQEISRKLAGGLSLATGDGDGSDMGVMPSELVHLLYLRLWLDTVNAKEPERECIVCGASIEESYMNRKYCGDACKQKRYRRRKAQNA